MRKRIQYAFNTDASTFWDEVYLHDEYTTRVYPEAMGWKKAEILETKSSGHGVRNRRVRVFPQLDHFKMFSKFLGSSFSYVEEGRFEPRKQLWQFNIAPPSFKNQFQVDGAMFSEDQNDATVNVTLELNIRVRALAFRAPVERILGTVIEGNFDRVASFTRAYISEKGLGSIEEPFSF